MNDWRIVKERILTVLFGAVDASGTGHWTCPNCKQIGGFQYLPPFSYRRWRCEVRWRCNFCGFEDGQSVDRESAREYRKQMNVVAFNLDKKF